MFEICRTTIISREACSRNASLVCAVLVTCVGYGLLTESVHAHSSGASLIATSSPYIVDIGYEPGDMQAGRRLILDIELENERGEYEDFTRVWMRVEKDEQTILATAVGKAEFGPTTFMIRVPEEWVGASTLHVRFESGAEELARAEFPISIREIEQRPLVPFVSDLWLFVIVGVLLAIGGGATGMFIGRRSARSALEDPHLHTS